MTATNYLEYGEVKAILARIAEREEQMSKLRGENANDWKKIEDGGRNRAAIKAAHKMRNMTATAAAAYKEEFDAAFGAIVQPKIDEAAAGQKDE